MNPKSSNTESTSRGTWISSFIFLLFTLVFSNFSLGCSESSLSGASSSTKKKEEKKKEKKVSKNYDYDDDDEDNDDDDEDLGLEFDDRGYCNSKSGAANIILVIDNTKSMDKDDVREVRSGGSALISEIETIAKKDKSPTFNISVVGFGNGSSPMPNGWVDIKDSGASTKLNSDLNGAADPDRMGDDSVPDAGLEDAKQLFNQLPTNAKKKNHRNFVILYTDYGIEDDSNERNLPIIASSLANDIGAAILVVGFGDNDDRAIWDSIALPKTGTVSPNHIGKHVSTGSSSQLTSLFKDVVHDLVADCD